LPLQTRSSTQSAGAKQAAAARISPTRRRAGAVCRAADREPVAEERCRGGRAQARGRAGVPPEPLTRNALAPAMMSWQLRGWVGGGPGADGRPCVLVRDTLLRFVQRLEQ